MDSNSAIGTGPGASCVLGKRVFGLIAGYLLHSDGFREGIVGSCRLEVRVG